MSISGATLNLGSIKESKTKTKKGNEPKTIKIVARLYLWFALPTSRSLTSFKRSRFPHCLPTRPDHHRCTQRKGMVSQWVPSCHQGLQTVLHEAASQGSQLKPESDDSGLWIQGIEGLLPLPHGRKPPPDWHPQRAPLPAAPATALPGLSNTAGHWPEAAAPRVVMLSQLHIPSFASPAGSLLSVFINTWHIFM